MARTHSRYDRFERPEANNHGPPLCLWKQVSMCVRVELQGVLNYVILRPLCTIIALITSRYGVYGQGQLDPYKVSFEPTEGYNGHICSLGMSSFAGACNLSSPSCVDLTHTHRELGCSTLPERLSTIVRSEYVMGICVCLGLPVSAWVACHRIVSCRRSPKHTC